MKKQQWVALLLLVALFTSMGTVASTDWVEASPLDGGSYYFLGTTVRHIHQVNGVWEFAPGSNIDNHSWKFNILSVTGLEVDPSEIEVIDAYAYEFNHTDDSRFFIPDRLNGGNLKDYNRNYEHYAAPNRNVRLDDYDNKTGMVSVSASYDFQLSQTLDIGKRMNDAYKRAFIAWGDHDLAMAALKEQLRYLYSFQTSDPDAALRGEGISEANKLWFEQLNAYEPIPRRATATVSCNAYLNDKQAFTHYNFPPSADSCTPGTNIVEVNDFLLDEHGNVQIHFPVENAVVLIIPYIVEFRIASFDYDLKAPTPMIQVPQGSPVSVPLRIDLQDSGDIASGKATTIRVYNSTCQLLTSQSVTIIAGTQQNVNVPVTGLSGTNKVLNISVNTPLGGAACEPQTPSSPIANEPLLDNNVVSYRLGL